MLITLFRQTVSLADRCGTDLFIDKNWNKNCGILTIIFPTFVFKVGKTVGDGGKNDNTLFKMVVRENICPTFHYIVKLTLHKLFLVRLSFNFPLSKYISTFAHK